MGRFAFRDVQPVTVQNANAVQRRPLSLAYAQPRSDTANVVRWWLLPLVVLAGCRDAPLDLSADEVAIEYVGHAAFRIQSSDGSRIVIDPFGDRLWISYAYPDAKDFKTDAVFVSHPHYDHDGGVSQEQASPYSQQPHTRPGTTDVGPITVTGLKGHHAREYGRDFGDRNTVWQVQIAGLSIVHWGDNDADLTTLGDELSDVDILMLPIDAYEHILYFEEVDAIRDTLRPRVVVPMHYRLAGVETGEVNHLQLGNVEPWLKGHDGSQSEEFTVDFVCQPPDDFPCEPVWPEIPAQQRVQRLGTNTAIVSAPNLPSRDEPEVWVFDPSTRIRR